jgi:hypothetical protein
VNCIALYHTDTDTTEVSSRHLSSWSNLVFEFMFESIGIDTAGIGIGSPNILDKYNVPVKVDLPGVGKNLRRFIPLVLMIVS